MAKHRRPLTDEEFEEDLAANGRSSGSKPFDPTPAEEIRNAVRNKRVLWKQLRRESQLPGGIEKIVADVDEVADLWRDHESTLGSPPFYAKPTRLAAAEQVLDQFLSLLTERMVAQASLQPTKQFDPASVPEPALGHERFEFDERGRAFYRFADGVSPGKTDGWLLWTDRLGYVSWFRTKGPTQRNRWRLRVVPLGKTIYHMKAWLEFAIEDLRLKAEGKPSHNFEPWDLAEHAHILADEIEEVDWPPRPRTASTTGEFASHLSDMLALVMKHKKANRKPSQIVDAELVDLKSEVPKTKDLIVEIRKEVLRVLKTKPKSFRTIVVDFHLDSLWKMLSFLAERFAAAGDPQPLPKLTDPRSADEVNVLLDRAESWLEEGWKRFLKPASKRQKATLVEQEPTSDVRPPSLGSKSRKANCNLMAS